MEMESHPDLDAEVQEEGQVRSDLVLRSWKFGRHHSSWCRPESYLIVLKFWRSLCARPSNRFFGTVTAHLY